MTNGTKGPAILLLRLIRLLTLVAEPVNEFISADWPDGMESG